VNGEVLNLAIRNMDNSGVNGTALTKPQEAMLAIRTPACVNCLHRQNKGGYDL